MSARRHADDLRAAVELVVAATTAITGVVEDMHVRIASGPGKPLERPVRALVPLAYAPVKGITKLVGKGLDLALRALDPWLGESTPGPEREALRAALNGVLGDLLERTANPLALPMTLRHGEPSSRLLVLIHGSSMNDRQWLRNGHDHGAKLAEAHGFTPVYLLYNSGRHVSENGRDLDGALQKLVDAWPVPVDEIVVLAHSMGGLVARSAAHVATGSWRSKLTKLIFLGTPHHGSPLEVGGSWLETALALTSYSAPLARLATIRSAGVTDLRFGNTLDEHWQGRAQFGASVDPRSAVPLPADVACYAVAADCGRFDSDGLVPVASALGRHARPELTLAFPEAHQLIVPATDHLGLLDSPAVYAQLSAWLGPDAPRSEKQTRSGA